jgi:hypothetical protein
VRSLARGAASRRLFFLATSASVAAGAAWLWWLLE